VKDRDNFVQNNPLVETQSCTRGSWTHEVLKSRLRKATKSSLGQNFPALCRALRTRDCSRGGDEAQWQNRHFASFLGLAEEAFPELRGPAPQVWLDCLAAEHDNLRAALSWAAATSPEQGLRLAASLYRFWFIRGDLTEGGEWYARLLEALPRDTAIGDRARALNSAGILACVQGDHAAAQRLHQESLTIDLRETQRPSQHCGCRPAISGPELQHNTRPRRSEVRRRDALL
jgi:hypothetical protein